MKHLNKVLFLVFLLFISTTYNAFSQDEENEKSIKSDPNVPIFEVKNDLGQTVFAVYPGGVKIFVDDQQLKATGGGFTVGRIGTEKATGGDIFSVLPNNVEIIIDETISGLKATGGGFTVGRIGTEKAAGDIENFFSVTPDSTRVYIDETSTAGFAVGKIGTTTGLQNFMHLRKDNYFIGHNSGALTTGLYNLFLGYESGFSNKIGTNNTFLGYKTGYSNTFGSNNVFIGNSSVQSATGSSQNVAIGNSCASDVTSTITSSVIMGDNALTGMLTNIPVSSSMFIGKNAGINLGEGSTSVSNCIFLGTNAGDGIKNTQYSSISSIVAVGNNSGQDSDGYRNVFIGNSAGSQFVGHQNTMIGFSVGTQGGSGTYNVYIGDQVALQANGDNNTYIGRTAGSWVNGSNNVFLGINAGRAAWDAPRTESNRLRIGSSNLIYGEFDNNLVRINGDLEYTGTLTDVSDIRLKNNFSEIDNPIKKLSKINGKYYYWKYKEFKNRSFSDKKQIGVIAQDVEKVFPELVRTDIDGYKSVDYIKFTPILIEAIKEQQKIIEKLEKRINQLEKKNETLSAEVNDVQDLRSEMNELKALVKELAGAKSESNQESAH
ncbi:MAG: tail fiber domain-containing protein [Bacteroidota bacterium]